MSLPAPWVPITILGPPEPYLSREQVQAYLGLERDVMRRLIKTGRFPRPYKGDGRKEFWKREAVIAYYWLLEMGPMYQAETEPQAES